MLLYILRCCCFLLVHLFKRNFFRFICAKGINIVYRIWSYCLCRFRLSSACVCACILVCFFTIQPGCASVTNRLIKIQKNLTSIVFIACIWPLINTRFFVFFDREHEHEIANGRKRNWCENNWNWQSSNA